MTPHTDKQPKTRSSGEVGVVTGTLPTWHVHPNFPASPARPVLQDPGSPGNHGDSCLLCLLP